MKKEDFRYNLPDQLIAQEPKNPRDHSSLLVLDRLNGDIEHDRFFNIVKYLEKGDVLVLNNSKVFPARLIGERDKTKGKTEILLHKHIKGGMWECIAQGSNLKAGLVINFSHGLTAKTISGEKGIWMIEFNKKGKKFMNTITKIGKMPLPPYITRDDEEKNIKNYQTVYANDKKVGSVAAPTAGLHFTSRLIKELKDKGIIFEYITLHVGLGTFSTMKVSNISEHKMHSEYVEISKKTLKSLSKARKEGKKIITVGTTSTRALESLKEEALDKVLKSREFWTDIFIYPGYKFKFVDAMITNFHLPESTLMMLVSAFGGKESIEKAYKQAINREYRFFSFGDAMYIK